MSNFDMLLFAETNPITIRRNSSTS